MCWHFLMYLTQKTFPVLMTGIISGHHSFDHRPGFRLLSLSWGLQEVFTSCPACRASEAPFQLVSPHPVKSCVWSSLSLWRPHSCSVNSLRTHSGLLRSQQTSFQRVAKEFSQQLIRRSILVHDSLEDTWNMILHHLCAHVQLCFPV